MSFSVDKNSCFQSVSILGLSLVIWHEFSTFLRVLQIQIWFYLSNIVLMVCCKPNLGYRLRACPVFDLISERPPPKLRGINFVHTMHNGIVIIKRGTYNSPSVCHRAFVAFKHRHKYKNTHVSPLTSRSMRFNHLNSVLRVNNHRCSGKSCSI